jgi:hypothetical protein
MTQIMITRLTKIAKDPNTLGRSSYNQSWQIPLQQSHLYRQTLDTGLSWLDGNKASTLWGPSSPLPPQRNPLFATNFFISTTTMSPTNARASPTRLHGWRPRFGLLDGRWTMVDNPGLFQGFHCCVTSTHGSPAPNETESWSLLVIADLPVCLCRWFNWIW